MVRVLQRNHVFGDSRYVLVGFGKGSALRLAGPRGDGRRSAADWQAASASEPGSANWMKCDFMAGRLLPYALPEAIAALATGPSVFHLHSMTVTNTASPPSPMKAAILPVTPLQQNCSLIWCTETNKAALVDPGGDLDRLKAGVAKAGVELEKILITHGHLDHCGQAGMLAKELGLPIEGPHEADRFWISRLDEDGARFQMEAASFEPDRWLEDGDTVTVGNLTLEVIHCPGHTPGHVIFFNRDRKFAIVGDVLFQGSIGRTDFPMSDHQSLIDAITQKLWPLGDDVTFIPGHGPTSTFGQERRSNPFVGDAALEG